VAISDRSGRFVLNDVRAGQYFIQTQSDGYLMLSAPDSRAVSVRPGQTTDVALTMVPGAVISGRVRDAYGQPLADVTVRAFTVIYHNGIPALASVAEKTTDDRGEYRLFWLLPGDYYVAAVPRPSGSGPKGGQNVRTFYPRAENASSAIAVGVGPGAQIESVDIDMAGEQLPKVSGRVSSTASPAPPPQDAQGVFAIIASTQNHTAQVPLVGNEASVTANGVIPTVTAPAIGTASGGQFEFASVLPGSYEVMALLNDRISFPAIGRAHIDVRDQDISGVTVQVHPGAQL